MTSIDELKKEIRDEVKDGIKDFLEDNMDCDRDCVEDTINDDGRITELVDGGVPVYNADIMEVGSDPEVFNHENELGPAFDGTPTPVNILATSIYEILEEEAWDELRDTLDEMESDGCFENLDDEKILKKCLDEL